MDVLILGGTRFFGRRLALGLLDDGHRVTVGSRGQTPDDLGDRVTRIRLDRSDPVSLRDALSGRRYDVVYDQICFNPREAQAALDALGDRVGRYVFTSTMAVYAGQEDEISESDFVPSQHPVDLRAPEYTYAEGKRQAEAQFFRHAPFSLVAARVCMVLSGTDDYTGRFDFHVRHVAEGTSIGIPAEEHEITYVTAQDVADFLRFVGTQSDFSGPVNAGNPGYMAPSGLARRIGRRLGREPRFHLASAQDPDRSPYALPLTLRTSVRLAREIGYAFSPLDPHLDAMVDESAARLGLR